MKLATLADLKELMAARPVKFTPEEVDYEEAPATSDLHCDNCIMYLRRAVDGLGVCEIMRSDQTDDEGVQSDWRCQFQSRDGDTFPLMEDDNER